jgi:hypothetical protein
MKATLLYRPNSEFSRSVDEFIREFRGRSSFPLEVVDVDSRDGTNIAEVHDIVDNPAVLVLRDDGSLVKSWAGTPLPLVNDVVGYLNS